MRTAAICKNERNNCVWGNIELYTNQVFELSIVLDGKLFRRITDGVGSLMDGWEYDGVEYIDRGALESCGITVKYRDSRYKKRIQLLVNRAVLLGGGKQDGGKLVRRLNMFISEYFHAKLCLDDFTLTGAAFIIDMDAGSRGTISAYIRVLRRIGKVKGFSPTSNEGLAESNSFCLSGNSNDIDFLIYDLRQAIKRHTIDGQEWRPQIKYAAGVLRAEIRLKSQKAIRSCTDGAGTTCQIVELSEKAWDIFMETFVRIVPYGDYRKKKDAVEIVRRNVKDLRLRRRMLRLIDLIPEKKSLLLAQKAMNYRKPEKILIAFAEIGLSPVTISKRDDTKRLPNIYSYLEK